MRAMGRQHSSQLKKGVSLIEVIVGSAIISGVLLSLGLVAEYSIKVTAIGTERLQAGDLVIENMEGLKSIRDMGWTANIAPLTSGMTYYLAYSTTTNTYSATTTVPALIDGKFTRTFVLYDVYRDANDRIAPSGTLDPNTKKIFITVTWTSRNKARSETLQTYTSNIFNN